MIVTGTGLAGVPTRTAYAASKHAMRGFFDSLRVELAGSGVTVTVAYPGFVATRIAERALGGDGRPIGKKAARVDDLLRYAMSLPVATTVSGIDSLKVLRQNLKIARGFSAMDEPERRRYERQLSALALDGRFELYKTTANFDGDVGREQHGFPAPGEVAL